MKKIVSFTLAALCALSLCLSSCSAKLEPTADGYYCSKNKVTYKLLDFQYVPVALGEEYATLKDGATDKSLFALKDVAPEKWLATDVGDLFCAVTEKIPTFYEMDMDKILICTAGGASIVSLVEIKKDADVEHISDLYTNGMTIVYPDTYEISENLILRFNSDDYHWFYYSLSYVEFVQDVLECDYPDDISTYTYRDVDDSVKVETVDEFECWFRVSDNEEQLKYENIAKDAGVEHFTVTKPYGDETATFVVFVFGGLATKEECVDLVLEQYDGELSEAALKDALSDVETTDRVTKVEYNYGKYFIYDKFTGKCVKVDDLLHRYRNYQIKD